MEPIFYEVRVGTRTKAGHLNVLHSFVCKSVETQEYKINNYFSDKYKGFSVDVYKVIDVIDISNEILQNNDPFQSNLSESKIKIKELEKQIKTLQESKNSSFSMDIHSDNINVDNKLLYKKVVEDYKVYVASVDSLEKGIKTEIMEKYKPFASSINTDERITGSNKTMKFRLNLINKLF